VFTQTARAPDFTKMGLRPDESGSVGGYRVVTRAAQLRSVDGYFSYQVLVQYARNTGGIEATVARVRLLLLVGVLAGMGVALALALMLARRALAPIARLTATARDIEQTRDPSRRVPVPDSDDEVAELAKTLDAMLQALESSRADAADSLARQRQFVADASHELRTPLTSVLANLELLADVLEGDTGEAARSALRSTQRMRRLVGDLLLLARADAQREIPHQPTDLAQVVIDAAGELGPLAAEHTLELEVQPATVDGARDELHRLVLNLLENAMRHTPSGTRVRVHLSAYDEIATLVVADDGPGVPADLRDKVFERFVRAEGDHGGSVGLGLSIVRAVARSHGGDVVLELPADGGTRFVVTLPALVRAPQPEGEPQPA
jgi:signal transduction histidine kinase